MLDLSAADPAKQLAAGPVGPVCGAQPTERGSGIEPAKAYLRRILLNRIATHSADAPSSTTAAAVPNAEANSRSAVDDAAQTGVATVDASPPAASSHITQLQPAGSVEPVDCLLPQPTLSLAPSSPIHVPEPGAVTAADTPIDIDVFQRWLMDSNHLGVSGDTSASSASDERRQRHAINEQRRRRNARETFEDLRQMIPLSNRGNLSKVRLLQCACDYIRCLQRHLELMKAENRALRAHCAPPEPDVAEAPVLVAPGTPLPPAQRTSPPIPDCTEPRALVPPHGAPASAPLPAVAADAVPGASAWRPNDGLIPAAALAAPDEDAGRDATDAAASAAPA